MITRINECIIELISIDTNGYQGGDHGGVYLSAVDGTDNWIKDNSGFLATLSRELGEDGKVHLDPPDDQICNRRTFLAPKNVRRLQIWLSLRTRHRIIESIGSLR